MGLPGTLAQPVEQRTFNPLVGSSNLPRPTRILIVKSSTYANFNQLAFLFLRTARTKA
jgi:hypothetical protein